MRFGVLLNDWTLKGLPLYEYNAHEGFLQTLKRMCIVQLFSQVVKRYPGFLGRRLFSHCFDSVQGSRLRLLNLSDTGNKSDILLSPSQLHHENRRWKSHATFPGLGSGLRGAGWKGARMHDHIYQSVKGPPPPPPPPQQSNPHLSCFVYCGDHIAPPLDFHKPVSKGHFTVTFAEINAKKAKVLVSHHRKNPRKTEYATCVQQRVSNEL
jgi:hypothetical protein